MFRLDTQTAFLSRGGLFRIDETGTCARDLPNSAFFLILYANEEKFPAVKIVLFYVELEPEIL